MAKVEQVCRVEEIVPGEMKRVEVDGTVIVLIKVGDEIVALGAECTHAGGPLDEGILDEDEVICPWHGGQFNLLTGEPTGGPPINKLPRYKVWVEGDDVLVDSGETVN